MLNQEPTRTCGTQIAAGLGDARVITSAGSGINAGMPLMQAPRRLAEGL